MGLGDYDWNSMEEYDGGGQDYAGGWDSNTDNSGGDNWSYGQEDSGSGWGSGFGTDTSSTPGWGSMDSSPSWGQSFGSEPQASTGGAFDRGLADLGNTNYSQVGQGGMSIPGGYSTNPTGQSPEQGGSGFDFSKFLSSLTGGGKNVLSSIFGPNAQTGNQTGGGGSGGSNYNDIFKTLLSLYAARDEKKSAADFANTTEQQLASNNARMDPFAGERRQYMDLLSGAGNRLENLYANPNSSPMYTAAKAEMERRIPRQFSKNRFSMGANRAMAQAAPEIYSKALTDARDTFKGYLQPAGANINPDRSSEIISALLKAQQATAGSGNAPYFDALGNINKSAQQQGSGNAMLDELRKLVARG